MAYTLSIATAAPPLGRQLSLVQTFLQSAEPPVDDYPNVLRAWNEVRCNVLAPNQGEVPIDAFGRIPAAAQEVPRFAWDVGKRMRRLFGEQIEQLSRNDVNRALCEEHEVTSAMLTRCAARGLIPIAAVQAFNASAAVSLERRLRREHVKFGEVIRVAAGSMADVRAWSDALRLQEELAPFLAATEFSSDRLAPPETPGRTFDLREHVRREIGAIIEESLKLLVLYGKSGPSSFFHKHCLKGEDLQSAARAGLLPEASAAELYSLYASAERKVESRRHLVHVAGLVGLAGIVPLWYEYLQRYDSILLKMLHEDPRASVFLAAGVLTFTLLALRPYLFAKD